MPVSAYKDIRERVRRSVRDTFDMVWSDADIDRIINEAQREYAIVSGSLIGKVAVTIPSNGVFVAPDNFIEPVSFVGTDGMKMPLYSWRYLHDLYPDFRNVPGSEIRGLVDDFDGFGKFRAFPKVPGGTMVGTLCYKRFPEKDKLETTNIGAIEQHCLFQMFLLMGNGVAGDYYRNFITAINREGVAQRGMKNHSNIRRGRFF